jgi:amidohydrolase
MLDPEEFLLMTIDFHREALALQDELVARRRDFHRHPELAFEEIRTARIVAEELNNLGIEARTGVGQTGVVGLLEGDHDGPTVLIRADMDALPILEENQTDYVSENTGVMHACGHDGHTTIALAVAKLLAARREEMAGRVKFVFQPAEEIGKGAAAMIGDGVLDDPRPDVSLGLHLWNQTPAGRVGVEPGPVMAAAEEWHCTITGVGGHGAAPHETRDPIVASAQIITALQSIVARDVDPLDVAVVTVGKIRGGDAYNVIPAQVELSGTVRTFLPETRKMIIERMRQICESVASGLNCEATLKMSEMTPAVVNDDQVTERVQQVAADVVGAENVLPKQRTMIAEDMARLMDGIPGCFFFVGSQNSERGLHYPHHNPRFDIDEAALPVGVAVLAGAAASYLFSE